MAIVSSPNEPPQGDPAPAADRQPASDTAEADSAALRFLRWIPWVLLVLLLALVALVGGVTTEKAPWPIARFVVFTLLLAGMALWFMVCFTGPATEGREHHSFVFAYGFTFGAFALLILPFIADTDAIVRYNGTTPAVWPRAGAIQLVRGCVVVDDGNVGAISSVARCPEYKTPSTKGADGDRTWQGREVDREYGWLVAIGGTTQRRLVPEFKDCDSAAPPCAKLAQGVTDANDRAHREYAEIHGGLAVPLFVVVLAYIGGAVSLSRRIPEYQRRSDVGYVKDKLRVNEPPMLEFETRESVVFQIMQLVSAPFLALASWYIVTPATLASGAVLAFGTGFFSEPILLMIRGLVEGIRPAATRTAVQGAAAKPVTGQTPQDDGHADAGNADGKAPIRLDDASPPAG
ncbi:hypothetical protein [Derxia gummosa]|uniref:Uncharacterized protein n=1 Tax=Derxia gummosa DSM 723 TaxID=1121388 RepID=A0A8B6X411_9BURK|nr:hypothetical protein [Derxia gummosa]